MAYASNSKGFRNITVNGETYRWHLKMMAQHSNITLQGKQSAGQQAIVTLSGIGDPWLTMPNTIAPHFVVTPTLIRRLILLALQHGWSPHHRVPPLKLELSADQLSTLKQDNPGSSITHPHNNNVDG